MTCHQKGFTLVELAIALVVIGLLIGGVLKGKELIFNTKIVAATRQINDYNAAVAVFMDMYDYLPGDIINPSARILNCTTDPCAIGGDGNKQIGRVYSTGSTYLFSFENNTFWSHLYNAGLVPKIGEDTGYSVSSPELGFYPEFVLGGRLDLRYYQRPIFGVMLEPIYGHSLMLGITGGAGITESAGAPVYQIASLDHKLDDGKPWSGNIRLGSSSCATAHTYNHVKDICSAFLITNF